MHGAGNDFVVLAADAAPPEAWPVLSRRLCDRHFGAGGDGLLVALPSTVADVRMRMFNPDGTEDECGNGLRCLALFAVNTGLVSGETFAVETISGVKGARVDGQGKRATVTLEFGHADLAPAAVPTLLAGDLALGIPLEVAGELLTIHPLSTGTAHTVIFERPDEDRFSRLSPLLELHPAFPERTSVMWTEVLSPEYARVRIWERGAGETLACGTGACAVAVAGKLTGRTGARVAVESRGGTLTVEVGDDLSLRLTGPAEQVYEGYWLG
jgi:diaminopimelate epimerase